MMAKTSERDAPARHRPNKLATGVFAFEGDPEIDLRQRYSVRPVLQFLRDLEGLEFIHRDIGTVEELEFYVKKWTLSKHQQFQIGYFSFHGGPGELGFADQRRSGITLEQLARWIDGRAQGRIIHFFACAVMALDTSELQDFRKHTGARAVTGYSNDVDWLEPMSFDALMLGAMCRYQRLHDVERFLRSRVGDLSDRLGFRIIR